MAELRYGALFSGWGSRRLARLERAIKEVTVVTVTNTVLNAVAQLRSQCRTIGHPLHQPLHHADLWIATAAILTEARLVTADKVFTGVPGLRLLDDQEPTQAS